MIIKYLIFTPIRVVLIAITLVVLAVMDLLLIRIIGLNFKQKYLIEKKDVSEMFGWAVYKGFKRKSKRQYY